MTPEQVIAQAERLGALSPEAVRNIVIVGLLVIALIIVVAGSRSARAKSKAQETESKVLAASIDGLVVTLERANRREDKAEERIAQMTLLSEQTLRAVKETLDSLLNVVNRVVDMLGSLNTVSASVSETQSQVNDIKTIVTSMSQHVSTVFDIVMEMQREWRDDRAALMQRIDRLEAERQKEKS